MHINVYDDRIHGAIRFPDDIYKIIMTKPFQRLKEIHQLGFSYITVPTVNHTRYEHCIGTYVLAGRMLDALEKNTKDLEIPELYKKAVKMAALLHDVGHGPLSHTWEFICDENYHHELVANECIDEVFKVFPSSEESEYVKSLVKSFVVGRTSSHPVLKDKTYHFLYDIVNNKQCDVDVDKWDYLMRDYSYIKKEIPVAVDVDFEDVFMNARASDDREHVEYRYCDFQKIYNVFHARATFHIYFYRRPFDSCLEQIMKHIIRVIEHDPKFTIDGIKVRELRSKDMNAFLKFTDKELFRLLYSVKVSDKVAVLRNCLESGNICEVIPCSEEDKMKIPDYLTVETTIEYPGYKMQEDRIPFYGDESSKPKIEQEKGFYKSVHFYKLVDSSDSK